MYRDNTPATWRSIGASGQQVSSRKQIACIITKDFKNQRWMASSVHAVNRGTRATCRAPQAGFSSPVMLLLGAGKAGYTGNDQDRRAFWERLVALGCQQALPRPQVGLPRIPLQGLRAGHQLGVASAKAALVLRFDFKEL